MSDSNWAPDRVWLQKDFCVDGGHTWCDHPIHDDDSIENAEYVRVDRGAHVATLTDDQCAAIQWAINQIEEHPKPALKRHSQVLTYLLASQPASDVAKDAERYRAMRAIYRESGRIDAARESDEAFDARVDADVAKHAAIAQRDNEGADAIPR